MYPEIFGFLDSWILMLCLGIIVAVLLFKKLTTIFQVDNKVYNFYSLNAIISIGVGLIFGVLFQSLYDFIKTGKFALGGMTFMGGLVGGVLTFIIITLLSKNREYKNQFYTIANLAAPCIVIAHAIGRIGCFLAGCCYGKPTDSFLGVTFPHIGKRYPTQLYECFFLLILFSVMMVLLFKYKKGHINLLLYGYAYSIFRFIIEFLRDDDRGAFLLGLSPSQWQSIVLLLVIITLTIIIYKFKKIPFSSEQSIKPIIKQQNLDEKKSD